MSWPNGYHSSLSLLYSNSTKFLTPKKVHIWALLLLSQAISCDTVKREWKFSVPTKEIQQQRRQFSLSLYLELPWTLLQDYTGETDLVFAKEKKNPNPFMDYLSDWEVILKSCKMTGAHPTKDQFCLSFLQKQHVITPALPCIQQ